MQVSNITLQKIIGILLNQRTNYQEKNDKYLSVQVAQFLHHYVQISSLEMVQCKPGHKRSIWLYNIINGYWVG